MSGVAWRRVGLFYGIAFGGAVLVALVIWALQVLLGPAASVATLAAAALLYMPLPLVAGLVVERTAGRRPLIAEEWQALRQNFWRTYGRNALVAVVAILAILAVGFVVAWVAGALGVPGAGHLAATEDELRRRMLEVVPGMTETTALPPVPVIAVTGIVQGTLAGLTINGLFAFGEEYGWRGVLAEELRPLGVWRANLLTGLLWGFWHAPIIMLGHNYGREWGWGILAMIAWVTPLSFLLSWARRWTGSVLAPAFLHGAYNGTIGIFTFLVVDGHLLVSLPMGVLMVLVLSLVAAGAWLLLGDPAALTRRRAVAGRDPGRS